MRKFDVTVVREAGSDPMTGKYLERGQEEMQIEAANENEAYSISQRKSSLPFFGQIRRTFIDGEEYFDPRL